MEKRQTTIRPAFAAALRALAASKRSRAPTFCEKPMMACVMRRSSASSVGDAWRRSRATSPKESTKDS